MTSRNPFRWDALEAVDNSRFWAVVRIVGSIGWVLIFVALLLAVAHLA